MIEHIDSIAAMTAQAREWHRLGKTIGLVPTMGALHAGHLSLVHQAMRRCDRVITTIFVNPLQFGPGEDLSRYPRTLADDILLLDAARCDVVFTAAADAMYAPGFSTYVVEDHLARRLEGAVRPGHFRGVLTVVAKLFHITLPDVAFFGQKDAQQVVLIQRMVRDLNFPLTVAVGPIVREADGLAMSSRNRYLSTAARARATCLSRAIGAVRELRAAGERDALTLRRAAHAVLAAEDGTAIDYVELVDPETLEDLIECDTGLLLLAVRIDGTRLIDNGLISGERS